MKPKDKVIERLTGEPQPKEVLAIERKGIDYNWVILILDGQTIRTDDGNITWEINKSNKVMAHIKQNPKSDTTYQNNEIVTIKGNKEQIQNLLYNIGMGLPDMRIKPYWKDKDETPEI